MNVGIERGSINGYTTGGVCAVNYGTVNGCYNNADVRGVYAGGICGENHGTISHCYNTGDITGTSSSAYVGGICGYVDLECPVEYCYNAGNISTGQYVGSEFGNIGFCYYLAGTADQDSYYFDPVDGISYGPDVGNPKTLAELCALDIDGNGTVWSAGSASFAASDVAVDENNERMGTVSAKLPYLTVFREDAAPTAEVDVYNFSLTDTPDWQTYTPITTAEELQAVSDDLDGNYVLMNDIDLDGVTFTPIGDFTGKFSGNGKVVKNLTITTSGDYIGLFRNNSGLVMSLGVEGTVTSSGYYGGGIVGLNYGTVSGCYFKGAVSAQSQQGGIVGWNAQEGIVDNCFAIGGVTGLGNYAGGIVGVNDGTISHSYCASTVTLTGEYTEKGGVCALNVGTITNCFYNKDIYTDEDSTVGVEGLSTLDMTAADVLETMGFDSDIWAKTDNDKASGTAYYPYLKAFEEITAPYISYETKRTLAYDDEKAAPVYGESLFFEIGALIKFDEMSDFVPVKGGYASFLDSPECNTHAFEYIMIPKLSPTKMCSLISVFAPPRPCDTVDLIQFAVCRFLPFK